MIPDFSDRSPKELLVAAEEAIRERRAAELKGMRALLGWADVHSGDPQDAPHARPARTGGPRLISLGGAGTPKVVDLALLEMAVARGEGVFTTRNALADGFDLRHRLPQLWRAVCEVRVDLWVARKVASMSRKLDEQQVRIVDAAVAAAVDEVPSVVLQVAEAKVIEADPAAHEERIARSKRRRGVWISQPKAGDAVDESKDPGVRGVYARLDEGDAVGLGAMVDTLAERLAEHDAEDADDDGDCDRKPIDHYRAEALAMLAEPQTVLDFLRACEEGPVDEPPTTGSEPSPTPESIDEPPAPGSIGPAPIGAVPTAPQPNLRNVQLFVHVSAEVLAGHQNGVARVEGLGPHLLSQVRDLVRHHNVFLTPVIDLNEGQSVRCYEHPTKVKLRTELRTVGDVFPHSPTTINHAGRSLDHDHPTPFDPHGPPGQTGDHNDAPLTRHHHRGRTHLRYSVFQVGPDRWVWGTPHGLHRLVTTTGTQRITALEAKMLREVAVRIAAEYPAV